MLWCLRVACLVLSVSAQSPLIVDDEEGIPGTDLFDHYVGRAVKGSDFVRLLTETTVEECAFNCLIANFLCISFDYKRDTKECILSQARAPVIADEEFDVYIRKDFDPNGNEEQQAMLEAEVAKYYNSQRGFRFDASLAKEIVFGTLLECYLVCELEIGCVGFFYLEEDNSCPWFEELPKTGKGQMWFHEKVEDRAVGAPCFFDDHCEGKICRTDSTCAACNGTTTEGLCLDGSYCSDHLQCAGGLCQGSPIAGFFCESCPDGTPAPCGDDVACTRHDMCEGGMCIGNLEEGFICSTCSDGSKAPCPDGDACVSDRFCDGNACLQQEDGEYRCGRCDDGSAAPCEDGNTCSYHEMCLGGLCGGSLDSLTCNSCDDGGPAPCNDDSTCYTNEQCLGGLCHIDFYSEPPLLRCASCSDGGYPPCNDGSKCNTALDCMNDCLAGTCGPHICSRDPMQPAIISSNQELIFGNPYPDRHNCYWLLTPSQEIADVCENPFPELTFFSFSTEPDFDFLVVRDGVGLQAPLIGQYNGSKSPGVLKPKGHSMFMEFYSDDLTNDKGFAAQISFKCRVPTPEITSGLCGIPTFQLRSAKLDRCLWPGEGKGKNVPATAACDSDQFLTLEAAEVTLASKGKGKGSAASGQVQGHMIRSGEQCLSAKGQWVNCPEKPDVNMMFEIKTEMTAKATQYTVHPLSKQATCLTPDAKGNLKAKKCSKKNSLGRLTISANPQVGSGCKTKSSSGSAFPAQRFHIRANSGMCLQGQGLAACKSGNVKQWWTLVQLNEPQLFSMLFGHGDDFNCLTGNTTLDVAVRGQTDAEKCEKKGSSTWFVDIEAGSALATIKAGASGRCLEVNKNKIQLSECSKKSAVWQLLPNL